jgi:cation diffusion facilitator family transporter
VERRRLTRFAWLSIAAAVATIGLKSAAYLLTHSVGLYSDALESVVNLVGAVMALAMLTAAARPPDETHTYGHGKAEYFSSVLEGTLILVAAISIGVAAVERLFAPRPLEQLGVGLALSAGASIINLAVALILRTAGRRHRSITLQANAQHLLTDVWTSVGVVAAVAAVALTGWQRLDPIVALAVAANIVWSGFKLLRRSVDGLMDAALPPDEVEAVRAALDGYAKDGIQYHALRTRESGARRFVSFHVLVPGDWSVQRGHALCERIEADIRVAVSDVTIFTHLESLDDPASWDDQTLDRNAAAPPARRT